MIQDLKMKSLAEVSVMLCVIFGVPIVFIIRSQIGPEEASAAFPFLPEEHATPLGAVESLCG